MKIQGSRFLLVGLMLMTAACSREPAENEHVDEIADTSVRGIFLKTVSDSFGWLTGDWHLMDETAEILEVWLVLDDSLKGYTFERREGEPVLIDLMSLSNRDSVTWLNAMPVNQNNNQVISFALVRFQQRMARFENPAHDFPQWFEFYRTSDSTLNVQYGSLHTMARVSKHYLLE